MRVVDHPDNSTNAAEQATACPLRAARRMLSCSIARNRAVEAAGEREEREQRLELCGRRAVPPLAGSVRATPSGARIARVGATGQVLMPQLTFSALGDSGLVELQRLAQVGIVLYAYSGTVESREEDLRRHEAFAERRRRFARLAPGGAIIGVSAISGVEQFHRHPELIFEEMLKPQGRKISFGHHLISDEPLRLARRLGLPIFEQDGRRYYESLTLIATGGRVRKVFHPISEHGRDAEQALAWMRLH